MMWAPCYQLIHDMEIIIILKKEHFLLVVIILGWFCLV